MRGDAACPRTYPLGNQPGLYAGGERFRVAKSGTNLVVIKDGTIIRTCTAASTTYYAKVFLHTQGAAVSGIVVT